MNYYKSFVILIATSIGFLYGYDILLMKFVMLIDYFRIYFGLNSEPTIDLILSTVIVIGGIVGSIIAGILGDSKGRKNTLLYGVILMLLGYIINALSFHISIFILGRLFIGLAIGLTSSVCPVYLSEIVLETQRCISSGIYFSMMIIGMVASFLINYSLLYNHFYNVNDWNDFHDNSFLQWRLFFYFPMIVCFLLISGVYFLPETPRWLSYNQFNNDAMTIFMKLEKSSNSDDHDIQEKYNTIQDLSAIHRSRGPPSFTDFFKSGIRRRTMSVLFLSTFQQWHVIGILSYLCNILLMIMGIPKRTALLTIILFYIAAIIIFSSMMFTFLADKFGRQKILLKGAMAIVLLITLKRLSELRNCTPSGYLFIMYIIIVYTVFSFGSWRCIPWLYKAEIFPLRYKTKGSAIGSIAQYINSALILLLIPEMATMNKFIVFGIFFVGTFLSSVVLYFTEETKRLTLEQIENNTFRDKI
ncbi:hypothetical protein PIROE2DRAFT_43585 [Piromyces sp. E2]|nr:hypothetical protein PIROE2DRAFT_43585 [Piromyces sp. E2]|eukprot:OUM63166.1 hypothetical protein PIROE2DRAFT_43585 [Piromyces sp. E2]